VGLLPVGRAQAQRVEGVPEELEGVGIEPRLEEPLPLNATFRDESGKTVALGEFFQPGRPVVVNLVYFNCPMLCNVLLDGFLYALKELDWTPGKEFEIVTVSIDPRDDPAGAQKKRERYVERLGRPEALQGWHFLTGEEARIRELADALGFSYRYDEELGQFMHSAGLFIATPDGRLSRFLSGVVFDPQTLRLSLVEASDGKIGSPIDQFLLFCFSYDHTKGRYGPAALKIMRLVAALSVLVLGLFLVTYWRREAHRRGPASSGVRS
jgi:protein SCO1/2